MAPPRLKTCASVAEGTFIPGIISKSRTLFETYISIMVFSIMFYATIVKTASTSAISNGLNTSNSGSLNAVSNSTTYWSMPIGQNTTQAFNIVNTTTASAIINPTTNAEPNTTSSTSTNTSIVSSLYPVTTSGSQTSNSIPVSSVSSSSVLNSTTDEGSSFQSTSYKPTNSPTTTTNTILLTCPKLTVRGGIISQSTSGSIIFISCLSGFNIKGPNVLQCVNGRWNPSSPSCVKEKPPRTDVHNKVDVNDVGVPTWLLWTICAVTGLLGLLILCCVLYVCLKMFGCISEPLWGTDSRVYPFAERQPFCLCCLERSGGNDDNKRNQKYLRPPRKNTHLTFLEAERNRKTTSQVAFERNGQHSFRDRGFSLPSTGSPEQNRKLVVKIRKKQRAKSVSDWLPHSKNIRNINTSTK